VPRPLPPIPDTLPLMLRPNDQHELERLRRFKVPTRPDPTLRDAMAAQLRELKKLRRGVGVIAGAWESIVPPALAHQTELVSLARGTLTVRASDAAAKYELERLLRGGAEAALVRASPVALRKVRIVM
jgi:hypothetical protein